MEDIKGLKIKDSVAGKVLTVDGNGVAKSSDKDINDIASANDLSNLESRVSTIEDTLDSTLNQLREING